MVKNFNLVQNGDKLENEMVVTLYQGETINLTFKDLEFAFVKANVRLNNIFVGATTNGQIGTSSNMVIGGLGKSGGR